MTDLEKAENHAAEHARVSLMINENAREIKAVDKKVDNHIESHETRGKTRKTDVMWGVGICMMVVLQLLAIFLKK